MPGPVRYSFSILNRNNDQVYYEEENDFPTWQQAQQAANEWWEDTHDILFDPHYYYVSIEDVVTE